MFVLLMIFTLTDSIVTTSLLHSGYYIEANPIMQTIFNSIGQEATLWIFKPMLSLILGILVFTHPETWIHYGQTLCVIIYSGVMVYLYTLSP